MMEGNGEIMIEEREKIQKIETALQTFRQGYLQMIEAFSLMDDLILDSYQEFVDFAFSKAYPFDKDFNELAITEWLYHCEEQLQKVKTIYQTQKK